MNEYQMAMLVGVCLFGAGVAAYIFSWIAQWAWAWVDDSKTGKKNWISSKVTLSRWKYPVYNKCEAELEENGTDGLSVFGYAKDKKLNGCSVHGLIEEEDYIYTWRIPLGSYPYIIISFLFAPIFCVFAIKAYPVTIGIATALLLAHLARFSRRHKKMFDEHVSDKNAHK